MYLKDRLPVMLSISLPLALPEGQYTKIEDTITSSIQDRLPYNVSYEAFLWLAQKYKFLSKNVKKCKDKFGFYHSTFGVRRRGGDMLLKESAFLARHPSPAERGWGRGIIIQLFSFCIQWASYAFFFGMPDGTLTEN